MNDFYVHSLEENDSYNPILVSEDNYIRVLRGDQELYNYSIISAANTKLQIEYNPTIQ